VAATIVQTAKGTSTLATVTAAFATAPTNGNVVILAFAADDYNGTPNAGWNQRTDMEQQTYHGGYVWDRVQSGGGNSFQYTIGSATNSSWVLLEISGLDASYYDVSVGNFVQSYATTLASSNLTPTAGDRLILAFFGASSDGPHSDFTGNLSASNSFTHVVSSGPSLVNNSDFIGCAQLAVTANGSTAYNTTGTIPDDSQSRSAMLISLKVATGGTAYSLTASGASYAVTGTAAILKRSRKLAMASAAYSVVGTAATLRRGYKVVGSTAAYLLTGTAATLRSNKRLAAATASYGVTGTAATLKTARKLAADTASYAVTGSSATLSRTRKLLMSSASYLVTGSAASLVYVGGSTPAYWRILCTHENASYMSLAEVSMAASSGGADLTSTANTIYSTQFNGTSNAASNVFDNNTASNWYSTFQAAGAKSWVGQNFGAPTLIAEMKVLRNAAEPGPSKIEVQYSYDGIDWVTTDTYNYTQTDWTNTPEATLSVTPPAAAYRLTASGGGYAVSGTATTLRRALKVAGQAGSYAVTGTAATLRTVRKLAAASGTYAVTGTDATLVKRTDRFLAAGSGAYDVTGQTATLRCARKLGASGGTYGHTGQAAGMRATRLLAANGGSYTVVGTDAALIFRTPNMRMSLDSGVYLVDGTPATLKRHTLGGGGGGKPKPKRDKTKRKPIPTVRDIVADIYRPKIEDNQPDPALEPFIPPIDNADLMRATMTAQQIEAYGREAQAAAEQARKLALHQGLAANLPQPEPEWSDEDIAIALLLIA
jgi:hypothetical protein